MHPRHHTGSLSRLAPPAATQFLKHLGRFPLLPVIILLLAAHSAWGSLAGPYSNDGSTLFLFHFDESPLGSNAVNSGSFGGRAYSVNLTTASATPPTVTNVIGASAAFSGFGSAANLNTAGYLVGFDYNNSGTYDGDVSSASLSSDAMSLTTLNMGNGSATPWTLEAMIYPSVTNQNQEIICTDSSASSRAFQFKINTAGQLEINFINGSSSGTADIRAAIPSDAVNGFVANTWYHVAATYDGTYVRLYWTKVGAAVDRANLLTATAVGINTTFGALSGPLCVGGENRAANGEYFRGLIDEVRISSICRAPNAMLFAGGPDVAVSPTIIAPASAPVGANVVISANTAGSGTMTNQWLITTNGVTVGIPDATNTSYVIQNVQPVNAGAYSLMVSDSTGTVTNTPATLNVIPLAGAGVSIVDFGAANPLPGTEDQSQTNTVNMVKGGNAQDGLNYYSDSTAPGQTFTTGSNPNGYIVNGVYVKTGGLDGNSTTTAQAYTLRLYSISGSTATLIGTYVTANTVAFPDGDWLLYSGGITNVLKPNTVYAYTHHRNSSGWDLMGYNNSGTDGYPGGNMCMIGASGGTVTFGASGVDDAAFNVSLSTTPTTPVIYLQPASQTVVAGQAVNFNVGVWATSPSYQWYTSSDTNGSNPTLIPGATGSTYTITSPTVNDATNYFAVINGSVTSSVVTLTVRSSVNTLAWLGGSSFNWDLTTKNWSNAVTLTTAVLYQTGDNVQFTDAGKNTSPISLTTALAPTSVTVSSGSNYIFAGAGSLSGNVQLSKSGTGTLIVSNANSFRGATVINNGVLRLANANALGVASNSVTVNGGTLDFGGTASPTTLQYNIQGTGYTNAGALANSGGGIQNASGILGLNLLGDATIGATGRWDLNGTAGGAGLQANGHNLTKVGNGSVFFIDAGTNNQLGDITVLGGTVGFQGTNDLGDPTKTITALGPGGLAFFAVVNNGLGWNSMGLSKNIVLSNAFFSNAGNDLTLNAPITLMGTNTQSAGYQETSAMNNTFNGPITGTGGWVINSVEHDAFNGTNTYSGVTILNSGGWLSVSVNGSLNNSSLVQMGNISAIIDVSATTGLVRGNGQTLAGIGTLSGNVVQNSGSTLSPGVGGAGTLSISGDLTLAGATMAIDLGSDPIQLGNNINDYISVSGNLNLSGSTTIEITPVGPLSTATPYTILTYGGTLTGSAANLHVVSKNPRYTFSVVNPATTPNSIQISVTGNAASLVWKGGKAPTPNVWNHSATNFLNTATSAYDWFYNGDLVTFDDTSATNLVNITDTNAPGLVTFANNNTNYTLTGTGNLSGVLDKEGTGSVTLALSNSLALGFITNNQGTLVLSPQMDSTLASVITDNGYGLGTITKAGTNVLTLSGANSSYMGMLSVSNGTLRYSAASALGGRTVVTVTNGGSLDINNIDTGTQNINIAGAGFNGQGALVDLTTTWPAWPYEIVHNVTLIGDAAIGANNRWDLNTGTLTGNGFKLTKVLGGQITLKTIGETGLGDIEIAGGNLTFQDTATMGDPTKSVLVESNASLSFWAGATTYTKSNVTLTNGTISSGGAANVLDSKITLQPGTNYLSVSSGADFSLMGPIVGAGGFIKQGAGPLLLFGNNTYTGPTTIGANSTVTVGASSSLGASSVVEIDGGSTLDVSALTSFTFGAGQMLIGNGTLAGNNVIFGSGSTLSVGFSGQTMTLSESGNLTLQAGSTNVVDVNKTTGIANDKVTGLTSVTMGGTLVINNIGSALAAGDAIPLFSATTYHGSFASIVPATPGTGLAWNTNTLATDGTLRVVSVAPPQIGTITVAGGNFVFSGSGGSPGTGFTVLSQTNMSEPMSNWTVIGTGTFDTSGNFSFTNGMTTPNTFYLIRVP